MNKLKWNCLYNTINTSNKIQLKRRFNNITCPNQSVIICMFNFMNNVTNIVKKRVTYYNSPNVNVWQGIASYPDSNNPLIISGTSQPSAITGQGIIYIGNISGNSSTGAYYTLLVPGAEYSSAYGPRYDLVTGDFTIVGSYNNPDDSATYGFLFRGKLSDLTNPDNYILKMNTSVNSYFITFAHSTYGNFVVGNSGDSSNVIEESWIYNINTNTYYVYVFPSARTTTLYGIVQNKNGSYTLTGGYSTESNTSMELEYGFVVDMDSNYNFSNATSIQYSSGILTHFEGISTTSDPNVYTLAVDAISISNTNIGLAMKIKRINGQFVVQDTVKINNDDLVGVTTSNSIFENNVVGLYIGKNTGAFQAVINNF
jgi:hypothetical protein